MVTHDQEAAEIADRIVTLTDGVIVEDRRVEALGVA
jgi:ABC-type lipoprotein export system ATPase subunit